MARRLAGATDRDEARERLREWLKPGQTIYCIVRSVARSGMSRTIDFFDIINGHDGKPELRWLSGMMARALERRLDKKDRGIRVGGCGMDMGFAVVYELGAALWPNGTPEPHGERNGEPDRSGGYALRHEWL